jgi:broad specificity phosphatase PhoE
MAGGRLYLVRHAQADGSDDSDPALSDVGCEQADALGRRLARVGATVVVHGPRRRARQTARRIASNIAGSRVQMSTQLDDRTPVPSAANRTDYLPRYWDWLAAVPVDQQDVDGRQIGLTAAWLANLVRESDAPIVAVTHAFVIGWIVQTSLAAPVDTWMTLVPSNASLTTLDCSSDGPHLLAYNDTGHLPQ